MDSGSSSSGYRQRLRMAVEEGAGVPAGSGPPRGEPGTWPLSTWVVYRPMAQSYFLFKLLAPVHIIFCAMHRQNLVAEFVNACLRIVGK